MNKTYPGKLHFQGITISIIVILTVFTYLNCLPNQFVYDDTSTIVENQLIKDWGNFPVLFTHDYFTQSGEFTYRPIVTLSYFADHSLWRMNPMGYHMGNMILHTINVILIYFFILSLFRCCDRHKTQHNLNQTTHMGLALLTCMFFSVHPIVSEVVNAVSYREDLLATAFLITSFIFFLLSKEKMIQQIPRISSLETGEPEGFSLSGHFYKSAVFLYTSAMITYFFALLSKESAIVLPTLIFSFDLLFNARIRVYGRSSLPSICKTVLEIMRSPFLLGYIGVSIVYLVVRFFILQNPHEKIAYPTGSFFVNMLTATKVLGDYIANMFLPLNLHADYHVLYLKTPLALSFVIPLFILISIAIIAIRLVKKQEWDKGGCKDVPLCTPVRKKCFSRVALFAILWFFISVLPVLNIIPLANIMADRYLYLPFLGFCLFLSIALLRLRTAIKYPVIVSLILFYIVITVTRNNVWRDEFTIWYNSSQSPFCSFTTYNNLGAQYSKNGYPDVALRYYRTALQKAQEVGFSQYAAVYYNMGNAYEKKNQMNQAIFAYKKAIQIKPDYRQAHNNLGRIYFTMGQYDNAISEYNTAIMLNPNFAYAYNNLGVLYNKLGRQDDAMSAYKRAVSLDPQYGDAYYNLGNIYEARKQYDLAIEAYQNALNDDPAQAYIYNNLGTIYDKKGRLEDAIREYRHAIRFDPTYPYSHNNLGTSLTKKGDIDGALAEFQKAVDLLPDQPDFHFNLGYTYLQKNDLDRALKEFETTLRLDTNRAEALFYIGTIYYRQGQKENAVKSWQAVLEINPNHAKAKKNLEILSR